MCGIIGVFGRKETAIYLAIKGMRGLQHRGQEGLGLAAGDPDFNGIMVERGQGEVSQVLPNINVTRLEHNVVIGQTRYSTIGASNLQNVQPAMGFFRGKPFAVLQNGSLVNLTEIARYTKKNYTGVSDTHAIADLLGNTREISIESAIIEMTKHLRGSYNLIILFNNEIYAVRDPRGFHPFQLGIGPEGEFVVASESYAFDFMRGRLVRDIRAGEYLRISKDGIATFHQIHRPDNQHLQFCIFESQYYLSPHSIVHGVKAGTAREFMGERLAREYLKHHSIRAGTIIAPIPDSGNQAALGAYRYLLQKRYDVIFEPYLIFRSHAANVRRAFILPRKEDRIERIYEKFHVDESKARGKHILLVDDTLVEGLSSRIVIEMARSAGAREVSLGIASPRLLYPDLYGNNMYERYKNDELIARKFNGNVDKIAHAINADNLCYLPLQESIDAILEARRDTHAYSPHHHTEEFNRMSFHTAPYSGIYAEGTGDFPVESLDFMPISTPSQ